MTATLAVPVALVVTAGTSLAPFKVTVLPPDCSMAPPQPVTSIATMITLTHMESLPIRPRPIMRILRFGSCCQVGEREPRLYRGGTIAPCPRGRQGFRGLANRPRGRA